MRMMVPALLSSSISSMNVRLACFLLIMAFLVFVPAVRAEMYPDDLEDEYPGHVIVGFDANSIEPIASKRACIRRGGNCDHRPNDCCYNSSCRCNLWGTNCRCQRMGLFQKWG